MARTSKPQHPSMSRDEWAHAFARKLDELRPNMGRKYLATVVVHSVAEASRR